MAGVKAQVAREVCAASAAFASCTHHRRRRATAPFVDWYLVLAIGEAASEEAIRRRYRHLALQLHPDKNRHPKAELAFNLVSEVYNQRTTATAAVLARMRIGTFDSTISTLLFMMISGAGVHSESLPFWLSLTPFCCS